MQISGSALSAGLSAIQTGQRRVDQAAADIAGNAVNQQPGSATQLASQVPASEQSTRPELADSLVALNVGKVEAQAGARVVETADEVLGTLIDTRA